MKLEASKNEYSEALEPLHFILHYEQDDEKGSDTNE